MKLTTKDVAYLKRFSVMILTGGSSGIGCSLIKATAKVNPALRICNLSRTKPAFFLGEDGVHLGVDLSEAAALEVAARQLIPLIEETPPGEILLVNNSGFGDYGQIQHLEPTKQLQMIDLNIRAIVDLTTRLLPSLLQRGGTIVNIASTAAFQPTPFLATYGATKTFVLNWTIALREDLRGTGVRSLAICPGPTRSNFFKAAGFTNPPVGSADKKGGLDMTADEVALRTLRAVASEKAFVVTGLKNRCITLLGSQLPIATVARVGAIILRKLRLEKHRES